MLILKIEGQEYKLVSEWSELTIQDAIEYYSIPQPEVLKALNKLVIENEKQYTESYNSMAQRDRMITLPMYYGKVIRLLSDVPEEVLERLFWRVRTDIYEKYLFRFCLGLDFNPVYQPSGIKFFDHGGQWYMIPDADRMEAVEWCEAADLELMGTDVFKNKGEVMARMMAVLCRPEGERYNEETITGRVESFKALPLNIVWEVYDFFLNYLHELEKRGLDYLRKEVSKPGRQPYFLDSVDSVGMVH